MILSTIASTIATEEIPSIWMGEMNKVRIDAELGYGWAGKKNAHVGAI